MKIIKLEAENIKRLVAIQITPDGNVVEITGRNRMGKSSVLDAIWWALAGAANLQAVPIRMGETHAVVKLDLGEIIVRREFELRDDGNKVSTRLFVETADGAKYDSPQTMLNKLLGSLSFDPMGFILADATDQYNQLKKFVPGIDFDAEEAAHQDDYNERREQNRIVKSEMALAQSDTPLPEDLIDLDEIQRQIDEVQKANDGLGAHRQERADLENRKKRAEGYVNDIKADIERLENQLKERRIEVGNWTREAEAATVALRDIGAIPEPAPVSPLMQALTEGARTNEKIKHAKLATAAMEKSEALSQSMENRRERLLAAIAEADLPVKGLTLAEKKVFLNGVPLDQASTAEKMDLAFRVAMAESPKLRVVFFRDASLLDDENYQEACRLADEFDCQVWVERVDGSGKMGFVIEDGMVKDQGVGAAE